MAQSAVNSGLESLAAEASRRAESMEAQAEAGPSTEANGSKSASQSSGQKGKIRKAYTITKQRERWTDSEHERFLQALKRYGRAWRKIEEHIGTKTAVQIRSHAQKFFSKLQREQSANGGLGDESSKAGISIPPPRPKRKPMHPYPRKNGDSSNADGSSRQPLPQQQVKQPSTTAAAAPPSLPAALPPLESRGGELSLSQVLEAAAMAAANAWSQVVASAGSAVQHQLQQGLQSMQPLMGMNPALLYQMAAPQQQPPVAANLQSSSQHPMGRSPFLNNGSPDRTLATASAPHQVQAQSMQDSPDGAGNAADQGNDRDSACSKEYSRGRLASGIEHALSSGCQTLQRSWPEGMHQPPPPPQLPDERLRHAWQLMTRMQPTKRPGQQWVDPLRLASLGRHPSRAFSAGPILHLGGTAEQAKQEPVQPACKAIGADSGCKGTRGSRSDTSQLAHYYQQAAEEQQAAQDADNVENGSSGEGGGSSGDGSNGKLGLPRSDKGSNTGNSGSDEDAHGNGSGSRSDLGAIDPADANANDGKGSDEGSNSPRAFTRNNSPADADPPKPVVSGPPHKPGLFVPGSCIDQARLADATSQLQHQQKQLQTMSMKPPMQAPEVLSHSLSAFQQQALSAWASSIQQQQPPQAAANNYQVLQGLLCHMQAAAGQPHSQQVPTAGDVSMGDRKSSGAPSMDTFNANSSRSYSVPPGVANGSVCSQDGANGSHVEEGSGFKPYNKRHGMPVSSLPPAKRYAAAARHSEKSMAALAGQLPREPATGPNSFVQPGTYSPFGSFADRARKV